MSTPAPQIIEVADQEAGFTASGRHLEYETLLTRGDALAPWIMPADEWESLALNYTSGTTGRPKGVVYHHRGAYLMTMGTPARSLHMPGTRVYAGRLLLSRHMVRYVSLKGPLVKVPVLV